MYGFRWGGKDAGEHESRMGVFRYFCLFFSRFQRTVKETPDQPNSSARTLLLVELSFFQRRLGEPVRTRVLVMWKRVSLTRDSSSLQPQHSFSRIPPGTESPSVLPAREQISIRFYPLHACNCLSIEVSSMRSTGPSRLSFHHDAPPSLSSISFHLNTMSKSRAPRCNG